MPPRTDLPLELDYVLLLFALFVVPRFLQRFRLPSAVTSFALGTIASVGLNLFTDDRTIALLATLGIVSLFLFAGLEVDFHDLRRELRVLLQHVALGLLALGAAAWLVSLVLNAPWRASVLVALALLTPSTGFILDSLAALGLSERERFWIKSKAVAAELVALAALFFVLQSETAVGLGRSTAVLLGMIVLLPVVFRVFALRVAPFAPKSEFGFLLMLAVLCASVTLQLGVYYLVGAFVVGLTAQRFRERLPRMASQEMLHAVEVFASFFIPFYFFRAGLHLHRDDFSWATLGAGAAFLVTMIPLRVALVAAHRRLALGESKGRSVRIGTAMLPTLVFTLVIVELLAERGTLPRAILGGLVIYALGTTLIPGFALGATFDDLAPPFSDPPPAPPAAPAPAPAQRTSGALAKP